MQIKRNTISISNLESICFDSTCNLKIELNKVEKFVLCSKNDTDKYIDSVEQQPNSFYKYCWIFDGKRDEVIDAIEKIKDKIRPDLEDYERTVLLLENDDLDLFLENGDLEEIEKKCVTKNRAESAIILFF